MTHEGGLSFLRGVVVTSVLVIGFTVGVSLPVNAQFSISKTKPNVEREVDPATGADYAQILAAIIIAEESCKVNIPMSTSRLLFSEGVRRGVSSFIRRVVLWRTEIMMEFSESPDKHKAFCAGMEEVYPQRVK